VGAGRVRDRRSSGIQLRCEQLRARGHRGRSRSGRRSTSIRRSTTTPCQREPTGAQLRSQTTPAGAALLVLRRGLICCTRAPRAATRTGTSMCSVVSSSVAARSAPTLKHARSWGPAAGFSCVGGLSCRCARTRSSPILRRPTRSGRRSPGAQLRAATTNADMRTFAQPRRRCRDCSGTPTTGPLNTTITTRAARSSPS